MKKMFSIILCFALLLSFTACTKDEVENTENTETTAPTQAFELKVTQETTDKLDEKLSDFEGIVYVTHNGELIYSHANGKDECGNDLTVDTPMYVGSVSKQFCATSIMILKEQNKLSVDDTLDKYFPEYNYGKDITIKNLLTMRSGIPEILGNAQGYSADKTESENIEIIKNWIFEQPLDFEPDTMHTYSNSNYFLLGYIVEIVSGQHYNDFIRNNIFEPLSMENSGFVSEVKDNDFFSNSLTFETFTVGEDADGLCKGAGDIVTTAPDIDKWMTGLQSGKIITEESYMEMIEEYSTDMGQHYGYAIMGLYKGGKGHAGHIGEYFAIDYFHEDYGINLYAVSKVSPDDVTNMPESVMDILVDKNVIIS